MSDRFFVARGLALSTAVLSGCASGPDYKPPQPAQESSFIHAPASKADEPVAAFWRGFNDPQLDALVDQALAANTDVKIAQARLQEARANVGDGALSHSGASFT